ncbi:MAG: LON peptidase substrate-binding domain-containing protein, partial [Cytophagales bacterium]|nr:LON peptidase substrate-binding domain-containing protein [Cytophagales bacterium]
MNDINKNLVLSSVADDSTIEMIPLLTGDEDDSKDKIPDDLPILPVRNIVLFPGVVLPITVGRQKSIRLVKKAYKGSRIIGVVAQESSTNEEPGINDIYKIGTIAKIIKMLVLPDGNTTIIIQGKSRFKIREIVQENPYLVAQVDILPETFPSKPNKENKALIQTLKDSAFKILKLNPEIPREAAFAITNIENPAFLTHFLSSNINVEVKEKQSLLEINDGVQRAELLLEFMMKEIQMLELKQEIQNKVNSDINQQQRDYFLRQQIKVLQDELGFESSEQDIENLRAKGEKKKWPEVVKNQ